MDWKDSVKYNVLASAILLVIQFSVTSFLESSIGIKMSFLEQLIFYILALTVFNIIVFALLKNKERYFKNISYRILKNKIISVISDSSLLFNIAIKRIDLVRGIDNEELNKYTLIVSATSQDIRYGNIDNYWDQKNPSDLFGRSFDEVYIKEKESDDEWFIHVQPSGKGLPDSVDKKHSWKLYRMGIFRKLKYLYVMAK